MAAPSRLEDLFRRVVALRAPILAAAALALGASAWLATRIPSEGSVDRLIVDSDPDYRATRAFQKVFPEGQMAVLLLEADDPWRPEVLAELASVEAALRGLPGVTPWSALDVFRRARPGFAPTEEWARAFHAFATGTDMFRRQGLFGDRFQGLALALSVKGPAQRDAALEAVDRALSGVRLSAVTRVRKVGAPWVESWIEQESSRASLRYFPLFGLFVVGIALFLYRSLRALIAILLSLGTAVAMAMGAGSLLGFSSTVVTALVPLTVMVTTVASLVYLHSRFVDQPAGVSTDDHQVFALANKFLPVTASTVAAVLGFAALAVSRIRPIREMGLWTSVGLALSWLVAFTVFPALQKVLRTPTGRTVPIRSGLYDRVSAALPGFAFRWRWALVPGSLLLAAAGAAALLGVPGRLAPMRVGVDSLDYVDPDLAIHRDMAFFRQHVSALNVARVWVRTPPGAVTDPEVLRGLDRLATAFERLPSVSAVIGPTTVLRVRRYLAGEGDRLPQDPAAFAAAAADVE
ncbi:MAG TPA: MMPL family transporter, partial [Anaeromyxobacteraceae bacterium]|nr:MMPL family transporter [Anaeromyxobacteraceae bacterium]